MGMNKTLLCICTLILSIGFLGAGYSIGKGIYLARKMGRTVTVKGLAEQDVKADLAIWEINYREVGNDLVQLNQRLQNDQAVVVTFLKQQGFTDDEIGRAQLRVEDRLANTYSQTNSENSNMQRYVLTGGTRVRSKNVELIQKTALMMDKILQQGVPLAFDIASLSPNPSFYFTQLDSIRPEMMSAATKSAYALAQQFSKDTGSKIMGISRANQGVFQVMSRDTSTMSSDWNSNQNALGSINQKVRLVTTIDYQIK